jgi:hypothetical protein
MALFASSHVYKQRLDVCKECQYFKKMTLLCGECGCFMPAKAKIANIRCPQDKWKEVYGTEDSEPTTITLLKSESKPSTPKEQHDRLVTAAESLRKEAQQLENEARRIYNVRDK